MTDLSTPPSSPRSSSAGVEAEVQAAGTDRAALQALRRRYQNRIARRSSDFEATHGLTLVERALADTTRIGNPWDKAVRKLAPDSSSA